MVKIKSYIGICNLSRAKYGAAVYVLMLIKEAAISVDWKFLKEILTDTREFLAYSDNEEYVLAVLNNYLEIKNINFLISRKILDDLKKIGDEFSCYLISSNELNLLNDFYISFISFAIDLIKSGETNLKVDVKIKFDTIMDLYNTGSEKEKLEHFIMSLHCFLMYHQFLQFNLSAKVDEKDNVHFMVEML